MKAHSLVRRLAQLERRMWAHRNRTYALKEQQEKDAELAKQIHERMIWAQQRSAEVRREFQARELQKANPANLP